ERRTVGGALVVDPCPRRHGRSLRAVARLRVLQRGDPVEVAALRLREAGGRGLDPAREDARALRAAGAVLLPDGPALDREVAAGAMTIAELRDLWGVGRKHALALAAHLDASGLTRRVGDRRALRRGAS